ncbi:hypothetical protein ACTXG5_25395 [Mycobacterium sp. Dal123C01]|uniref:hypothetical protein n=1 Tax=Mycobacterium sp. Dal123C01 TaxID=3457577 RepID=UPI00403EA0D8
MSQLERADDLAVRVFWFLGDHWFGPQLTTDEELAALRTAAFRLLEESHADEPLVLKAGDIAHAFLELSSPLDMPDSFEKLKKASNAYEQARLRR